MNRLLFAFLLILLVAIRKRDFANISRTPVEEPEHEEPRIVDGFEASDNYPTPQTIIIVSGTK